MPNPSSSAALPASTGSPLIIVIDDDEAVRDSLKAVLEAHGFRVALFSSGLRFLEHDGPALGPACLIIAAQTADTTGMDVVRELRLRHNPLPIILTAGEPSRSLEPSSCDLGAIALLDKPISPALLFGALQRALSRT